MRHFSVFPYSLFITLRRAIFFRLVWSYNLFFKISFTNSHPPSPPPQRSNYRPLTMSLTCCTSQLAPSGPLTVSAPVDLDSKTILSSPPPSPPTRPNYRPLTISLTCCTSPITPSGPLTVRAAVDLNAKTILPTLTAAVYDFKPNIIYFQGWGEWYVCYEVAILSARWGSKCLQVKKKNFVNRVETTIGKCGEGCCFYKLSTTTISTVYIVSSPYNT